MYFLFMIFLCNTPQKHLKASQSNIETKAFGGLQWPVGVEITPGLPLNITACQFD